MKSEKLFREESIGKLIAKTSLPAIVTILVMMVYNMADMFFIGRTGDAMQVAAVSLAGPLMSILTGLGTLVGSGGCAAISNELGRGNKERVKAMSSFCTWFSIVAGVVFSIILLTCLPQLLDVIGTSGNTRGHSSAYLSIIAFGAPFMIFSSSMANVVRGEGAVKQSMLGNGLGSLVNIALDPLFILVFGMGVRGAAIATVIGNVVSALYFWGYARRKGSALSVSPRHFTMQRAVSLKVLLLGLPTSLGVLLMSVSSIIRNNIAVQYGDAVIAAMSVAGMVSMVVSMLQMGITMGVQPAIGYTFGAGLHNRMNALVKRTALVVVVAGSLLSIVILIARGALVGFFLDDAEVVGIGQRIVAIGLVSGPVFGLALLCTTFLQATDKALQATLVSLLRQGIVLLPATLLLNTLWGFTGFLWSPVVADLTATAIGLCVFTRHYRVLNQRKKLYPATV